MLELLFDTDVFLFTEVLVESKEVCSLLVHHTRFVRF